MNIELPYDHEIERAIVGRCMIDSTAFLQCISTVTKEYFTHPFYMAVWSAMEEIHEVGQEVDSLMVRQKVAATTKKPIQEVHKLISELIHDLPRPKIQTWIAFAKDYSARRKFMAMCQEAISEAAISPMEDFKDKFHVDFLEIATGSEEGQEVSISERIDAGIEMIKKGMEAGGETGITVGLDAMDKVNGGWQIGLHVIAGRPGNGKTEFAMFMSSRISKTHPVYFLQLEMSMNQSTYRQLSAESGIRYSKMQRGQLSQDEFARISEVAEIAKGQELYMDARGMNISQLIGKLKYHVKKNGIKIAFIDYVQIMEMEQTKNQTRDQAIGNVTRQLKRQSNDLGIPIILLAQLGKTVESRPLGRPTLSDLRESGNIENDADTVTLLYYAENYRDMYKDKQGKENFVDPHTGKALDEIVEFIWAKHRGGTPNLSTFAKWPRGTVRYTDELTFNRGQNPKTEQIDAF